MDSAREFIPFGIELPGQDLNIYNSLVQGVQGKEGKTWGLPYGIDHPYSNTPPQTTWFPSDNKHTNQQVKEET